MKAFSLAFITFLAILPWSLAYHVYAGNNYAPTYTATASASASVSIVPTCCELDLWAQRHRDEVIQMAERIRQEYSAYASGRSNDYTSVYRAPWRENIIQLTGKTANELDEIARKATEQLITDMRKGNLNYETYSNPRFFEFRANQLLQSSQNAAYSLGQQQQQIMDFGQFPTEDLNAYDEVKNYSFPAEVKMIDGRPYVVHTNYTEAKKNLGDGVLLTQRNRSTIATSNTYGSNMPVYTQQKNIHDWYRENVEPEVADYKPVWMSHKFPVENDAESISGKTNYYVPSNPRSTVTVHRYNKTIIRNSDGTNRQYGSELNKKWVDGKLVYDSERPFGTWTVPRDEQWKLEERERLFWLFTPGVVTTDKLVAWQRQQEERLVGLAERHHCSLEEIQQWQRQELERYLALLNQYKSQTTDMTAWQHAERGRLDWLIHQNSVTREDLMRWQAANMDKIKQLAASYGISVQDYKNWQFQELNRLYTYFNKQNNSMVARPFNAESLRTSEQARLEELIRQHNATIEQLQNSIKNDQQKLANISKTHRGNVQDVQNWLQAELQRLKGEISAQHSKMETVSSWRQAERGRLENILKQHRGSVNELENQIARDRTYVESLAAKYKVSIEDLENWQRAELQRLQNEGQQQFNMELKEWQRLERAHLQALAEKNDLTIEEFQAQILNDRARLQQLAAMYKVQVAEVEEWIRKEIKNFQSEGLLKQVQEELQLWQQQERQRIEDIVKQNALTVEELTAKIKNDQTHLFAVANKYQLGVEEVEQWLKQELLRLQSEGLVKVEDLQEWQKSEREDILKIVQENKLTIEEFERKLLNDKERLTNLASNYNIQTSEIESWIKKEGERLQNLGMLQMREELNNWQQIERQRLLDMISKSNLTIEELEEKINKDQVHLYSLAHQHQVRVEEIEEWIKKEIQKLQQEGVVEMSKLKNWQMEWRGNLTNMVKERDFTVEEFHKWLLEDRARLQALANQHNVQIEEIENWVQNEEQRFVSMGLLKPNEKLTNWQEIERRYLERLTEEQYHSTEQLEQRLRQDRELLQQLARDYSVQVEEVEQWTRKELARLRDEGQLQIDNLTAWQIAERERLEELIKQNKQWSVEDFEAELRRDREHMQRTAFQYHTSVEEIEKWLKAEVERLQAQGKLNIENLTAWQKAEHKRILNLLQQKSTVTAEEFEQRIQKDRRFIMKLANQYHVGVGEIEAYVKQVIEDLRNKGRFEIEQLQNWQIVGRDYIKAIINERKDNTTFEQLRQKLLNDTATLYQLSQQYHINVVDISKWMNDELNRLRVNSESHVRQLAAWQKSEVRRLKELIKKNNHLTYVGFESELLKERERLQKLARQYSLSVEEIEDWLRQQLVNLKTTGEIEVENLTQWQTAEQKRLIGMLLQEQQTISETEFNSKLKQEENRLKELSQKYSVSVEQIENWMRDELHRLKDSGLIQMEQLNQWQRQERERLENWLRQQQNVATYADFNDFLKHDKQRINNIAREYQVTVEQVEAWVQQEGARLQILGQIKPAESYEYIYHWENNNQNSEDLWKYKVRDHLKYFIDIGQVNNLADVERYLVNQRESLRNFAQEQQVTVTEIEMWLKQEAKNLAKQGILQGEVTEESWMTEERTYIDNLIKKRPSQWSIEELERQLVNDRQHLQDIAARYHNTVEEIQAWYNRELQELLRQHVIYTEQLKDWQRVEKERLYKIVMQQPGLTVENLQTIVLKDKNTMNHLADTYHVNIEELEIWIRNEINRLRDLGYINKVNNSRQWQEEERKRLRTIESELIITDEELYEFISNDIKFQHDLADSYGITLTQLAPVQGIEINKMRIEGLFDKTQLIKLENWQKIERDRFYNLIKTMNFSLNHLHNWQRQGTLLNELARKYGITVQELKDWQLKEYERLMKIADHYRMTLNQLEAFRQEEIDFMTFINHRKLISVEEQRNFEHMQATRTSLLEEKSGKTGEDLLIWRRTLYLLSQGLIPINFEEYGGYENGPGTTNRTGTPRQEISKDRGDQPPNVYYEDEDLDEPGLAGEVSPYGPPASAIVQPVMPEERPPAINHPIGQINTQGAYRYSKTQTKYNIPVMDKRSTNDNYNPQQQQQEEDFGQQQQVDLEWNNHDHQKQTDIGQQQQQTEDDYLRYVGTHTNGKYQGQPKQVEVFGQQQVEDLGQQQVEDLGQQQVQVEDIGSLPRGRNEKQVESALTNNEKQVEVTAEPESPGFFSKLKNKIFG